MKKNYIPPFIEMFHIEIEEGIANSSASYDVGGVNNDPIVEDWVIEEDKGDDVFFD